VPKILSIQYLRGIAALGVVIFHALDRRNLHLLGDVGAAGVDVFFVISGVVMWVVTSAKPTTPAQFIVSRIRRIVPLYWLCTLSIALGAAVAPSLFPRLQLQPDHVLLSLLFIPHISPSDGSTLPIFAAGWTLNYEMFFYVLFALTLILVPSQRFLAILAVLAAVCGAHFIYAGGNVVFSAFTDPIILEFAGGIILGYIWNLNKLDNAKLGFIFVSLAVLGFASSAIFDFNGIHRLFVWGLPAFLLVAGALCIEQSKRLVSSRILETAGNDSYSTYLSHSVVIAALAKLWPATGMVWDTVFVAFAAVASIIAGHICHILVERPLTEVLKPSSNRSHLPIIRHESNRSA